MSLINFRMAHIDDWEEILSIYEPYIYHTPVTFDYNTFTKEEFQSKMKKILGKYPYLVALSEGKIVGYGYCSSYLEKEGFSWDCEITIYINKEYQKLGIASRMYEKIISLVKLQGYYNIYALIRMPNIESVILHEKFGFTQVGVYKNTAYKLGKWQDLLVMEKNLREYILEPEKPKKLHDLKESLIDEIILSR